MHLDLEIIEGHPGKPVVILIHGLGMNRFFWSDPGKCPALGGTSDLSIFFSKKPNRSDRARVSSGRYERAGWTSLQDSLVEAGYSVASWSQSRPVGPIRAGIDELACVLKTFNGKSVRRPVFLIGHSRGGLIARSCVEGNPRPRPGGVVTIGTPHGGSRMADLAKLFTPAAAFLNKLLPENLHGDIGTALKQTTDFFTGSAIDELKPGAAFLRDLPPLPAGMPRLVIAGDHPHLFDLYYRVSTDDAWQSVGFPEILTRVLPERLVPDEILPGRGDGLVTVESAVPPDTDMFRIAANHVTLPYDPRVQDRILEFLKDVPAS